MSNIHQDNNRLSISSRCMYYIQSVLYNISQFIVTYLYYCEGFIAEIPYSKSNSIEK